MDLENMASPTDMNVVQFRIERGATAVGTDGVLGRVEHIVVERETRQLRSLIVRSLDSIREFELPAQHILRAVGHQVELDIGGSDLTAHPELAMPYDPHQYVPLYEGPQIPESAAGRASAATDSPVVTDVERDAAELVSANPSLAPEGITETVAINPRTGETAPLNDTPDDVRRDAHSATRLSPEIG
ncbi:MAG: PRC-barrel domain-containing protein, partial [Ktedonobacterales bacterium]|nr:PRC-barrel domain-containing protein [Ktedonobacterales bacterium]